MHCVSHVSWEMFRKRKRSETTSTSQETVSQIETVSTILKDKYHKGILTQASKGTVIFNICVQLSVEDVGRVLRLDFVDPERSLLFCNQFSLVFEVAVDKEPKRARTTSSDEDVVPDWKGLRDFLNHGDFTPPGSKEMKEYIPPSARETMDTILETVQLTLFSAGIRTKSCQYRHKKPYYTIVIRLEPNQVVGALVLGKIRAFGTKAIKSIKLAFDKSSNSINIILKVRL